MRIGSLLALVLACAACGVPPDAPAAIPAPVLVPPTLSGDIGPAKDIDAVGRIENVVSDDRGTYFGAEVHVDGDDGTRIMTRLFVADMAALAQGSDRVFAFGNDEGVSVYGCVGSGGSAEGFDLFDAPAEFMRISVDELDVATVDALLVDGTRSITTLQVVR